MQICCFKTAHIQIRFLGKDPVFKYGFLVLFSHPCIQVREYMMQQINSTDDDGLLMNIVIEGMICDTGREVTNSSGCLEFFHLCWHCFELQCSETSLDIHHNQHYHYHDYRHHYHGHHHHHHDQHHHYHDYQHSVRTPDMGAAVQLMGIIRTLLDPENMLARLVSYCLS